MLPYQIIDGGSFTSDASLARQIVQVSDEPDLIWVRNRTAWGDDAAETSVESWWRRGMAQGSAQTVDQAVTSGALSSEAVTSGGFRVYNTANPPVYSALGLSAITAADPAEVTVDSSTGDLVDGDVVRLVNTTGMLQVSGYEFEVNNVVADTTFELNLDASNFAAAATDGEFRLILPSKFYPRRRFIVPLDGNAGITQAANAVVSLSVTHDFTVGEKVRLKVPSAYGMGEANDKLASVLAVTQYTVTLDLDTSGFSAFAIPTSADYAAGLTPAQLLPAGAGPEQGANPPGVPSDAAYDNRNQYQIVMGSNIITSTEAVYDWVAYKFDRHKAL
jgi:hypothetical protein